MKQNQKWKIPDTVSERQTLCFSSYKNHKLKVKVWWVGALERKQRAFFVSFVLSEGNLFNISVLSQCIVCTEYTFRIFILLHIKKQYFIHFFLLDFKIVKSLQCILNGRAVVEGLVAKNLVDKKMDLLLNYWQLKTYIKLHIQTVHFPFQ